MPTYHVTWEIDIEADSPEEAATVARYIQLDPENIATVFAVDHGDTRTVVDVETDPPFVLRDER